MHRSTKKLQFDRKTREKIYSRDNYQCIFCAAGIYMESKTEEGYRLNGIMHYVARSQGGLGIEQNGALGCNYHHQMLDNDSKGRGRDLKGYMKGYLKGLYLDWGWEEKKLRYNKWEGIGK